jgi:hypothetical protein
MVTVIDRIWRSGDVGEPGYSCSGQSLRKCTYSGSKDVWHGATQDALSSLLPTCYITESVYSFLTKDEINSVRSRIQGIFPNDYAYKYHVEPNYGKCYDCWDLKPGVEARPLPPLDPCEGVVCEAECEGVDRYATVCKNGVCVRGGLVEADSTECGYVAPVCTEGAKRGKMTCWDGAVIYGEVCRGNKWVTSGEFCPPKPECAEGDKKPGYICSGGKWVPYTPEQEAGRLYVKFDIPWLDLLPGIPYEPWMIIPPGFKIVEEKQ